MFLHRPPVLFLDVPTIELDVSMQLRIREFVAAYIARYAATVLLTIHYMADVEALCERVIVIHEGRILFDGGLGTLSARFAGHKTIAVVVADPDADLSSYGDVVTRDGDRTSLRVPKAETPATTGRLLAEHDVLDLTIEDPPIEDVIERVFAQGASG